MKRLTTALVLGTALLGGAAACGSEGTPAPTTTEEAVPEGTLILESTDWVKNDSLATDVTEFEVIEGETYRIESMFGTETLEILEVTDEEVTVRVSGAYFAGDGMEDGPEFTLSNGETVGFSTASADAGVDYDLTYEIEE